MIYEGHKGHGCVFRFRLWRNKASYAAFFIAPPDQMAAPCKDGGVSCLVLHKSCSSCPSTRRFTLRCLSYEKNVNLSIEIHL